MRPALRAPAALLLLAGCDPDFTTHFDVGVSAAGQPVEGVTLIAFPDNDRKSARAQTDAKGRAKFAAGQFLDHPATVLLAHHPAYGLWVGGAGAQFPFEPRFGILGGPTDWDAKVQVQLQAPRTDPGSVVSCEGRRCVWTIPSLQIGPLYWVDLAEGTAQELVAEGAAVGAGAVRYTVELPRAGKFHLVADTVPMYAIDEKRFREAGVHVVFVSDLFEVAG